MSTQVRTWTEHCGAEGEPSRWDLSINDRPVPGGYIEKTAEGFEIHYPHLPLRSLGEALGGLLLRSGAIDENLAVVAAAGQHARGHHGVHAKTTHAEYLASFGRRDEVAVLVGHPSHFQASC